MPSKTCKQCGTEFEVPYSESSMYYARRQYCDQKCARQAAKKRYNRDSRLELAKKQASRRSK